MKVLVKYDIAIPHLKLVGGEWVLFQPLQESGQSALELHQGRKHLRITARGYNRNLDGTQMLQFRRL